MFQFHGEYGANQTGTFFVEGFTVGTDLLQITSTTNITVANLILGATHVTIAATDLTSPTDATEAHLVGMGAMQFTLSNGNKVDLVGVNTLNPSDVTSIFYSA